MDFDLGDWDSAFDALGAAVDGDPATAETNDADFDLGVDLGLSDWGFLDEPVSQQESAMGNMQQPQEEAQQQESALVTTQDMYGPVHDLKHLGDTTQNGIFANFCISLDTGACRGGTEFEDTLEAEYVKSRTIKSETAREESTGYSRRSIARGLLEYACILLYGSAFLIGAFFLAWTRLLCVPGPQFQPVMAIWKRKYDETPLKLKVKDHNAFFGTQISEQDAAKPYLHSKIFRIEPSVRFLALLVTVSAHHVFFCFSLYLCICFIVIRLATSP